MKNYTKEIADVIKSFLTSDDWHYSFDDEKGLFHFGLGLRGKLKKINYIIDVKEDEYLVYAVAPIGADKDDAAMMAAMAEFICTANYGLRNGNFEFDFCDGEIRYKTYVPCFGISLTSEIVRRSIYCHASMFDRYSEGIIGILFGGMTAADAINKCEGMSESRIRSILNELLESSDSSDKAMEKLADILGISDEDDDEEETTEESSDTSSEEIVEIRTDLFQKKMGGES